MHAICFPPLRPYESAQQELSDALFCDVRSDMILMASCSARSKQKSAMHTLLGTQIPWKTGML